MALKLYNYLTRKKEPFAPLRKGRVGLYTCGPTVYNYAHIGNLRTYLFEDVLRRTLESCGLRVRHVMNLTDVDDKTIRDSKKAGVALGEFTERYAREFFRDVKALGTLPAHVYPRATRHVREMIALISTLLKKDVAYRANDGVYFSIAKFDAYGKLSRVKTRALKAGARVSADLYEKKEASDFALWKFKEAGDPSWQAPFGEGRPGWHIECSAMAMKYLGSTLDIHAGAIDLLFPHHEDEIAQSEAATNKPFVRYFVEGEHLMVDGKKMSKSLGNFYTLRDIEKRGFDPLDFRFFVLGAHYRKPLNFTWRALDQARRGRLGILHTIERIRRGSSGGTLKDENAVLKVIAASERRFRAAIEDDLNAPKALALLNELLHYANAMLDRKLLGRNAAKLILATVYEFDRVFGLRLKAPQRAAKAPPHVVKLVAERERHRAAKRWREADQIRGELKKLGYLLEDTPSGPRVRKM